MSSYSVENSLSHSAGKRRRGILPCCSFSKFMVAKKCMDEREGEISRIPSKIFCLIVPKNAVEEPFSLPLISGIEEIGMRGWERECQDIPSKSPCLTVAKIFLEEPFRAVLSVNLW